MLELFEILASERIRPAMLRQVPYSWIPRSVRDELFDIFGDDSEFMTFNVYRMSATQWDELKQSLSVAQQNRLKRAAQAAESDRVLSSN
mgnify:FL=1